MRDISNSDDIIDSRDVIARISDLETERQDIVDGFADEENPTDEEKQSLVDWDEDNGAELKALQDLAGEADGYAPDWAHGATLIRHSYFVDYCQEMLQDIGDLPRDLPGYLVIDWEATASNIQIDYTTVDFDGVDYYVR